MTFRTRFAPSPTGCLHLGHAYSALVTFDLARQRGGRFLLRIEDTDQSRCRPEYEEAIVSDLRWLGIEWDGAILRQSERVAHYIRVLGQLGRRGLVFPCNCNRRTIRAALSAPQEGAPVEGPDGPVYPGACRDRSIDERGPQDALRLHMRNAVSALGEIPDFRECGPFEPGAVRTTRAYLIHDVGDVVLGRREAGQIAYHLASVVDDAHQEITHVVRGRDLFRATAIHVTLQALLGYPTPRYHHHDLIRDETGKRLAKRDDARAIRKYRAEGYSPNDIRRMVGLQAVSVAGKPARRRRHFPVGTNRKESPRQD